MFSNKTNRIDPDQKKWVLHDPTTKFTGNVKRINAYDKYQMQHTFASSIDLGRSVNGNDYFAA